MPVTIPVPSGGDRTMSQEIDVNQQLTAQLAGGLNAAALRRVDGSDAYAENLRYSYLIGKDRLSFPESTAVRNITGPHPQYGSPDGK